MHQPSFDTWTVIFLFAAIQGLFVSVALFFLNRKSKTNKKLLALLIFLFSVTLVEYVLYWTHYIQVYPHIIAVSEPFPFLFGVLLYFYLDHVFENRKIHAKNLVHFIPFIICLVLLLPIYLSTATVKREWLNGNMVAPSLFSWPWNTLRINSILPWLMIMHMSLYILLIYKKFYAISRTNNEVRTWFNFLAGFFILFVASFASYYILVQFPFFNQTWDYMISFSMMLFIYFIAWFGYLQPRVFSGFTLNESISNGERYKNSILDKEISREILMKLESAMMADKMYRENDLRLEKLAHVLQVSKHHLSQVINEQTGMNFFEYINHHRIGEAKRLLSATSKKELNIIDVAYEVGFNNKVSFNTAFKKFTGKTPTDFRTEQSEVSGK
jgi:AraC-like DNA-binding protein